ncbi:ATP-binding protein [Salmonella enterica]|nr:ATP-binding protein [Salmonella enterica]
MNIKDKAIRLLIESDYNIIVTGKTGAGKTDLILNCNDWRKPGWLTEESFCDFLPQIIHANEKTLILDAVEFPDDLSGSKIVHLIKTARKSGKRLIIVAYPENARQVLTLFDAVIHLEMSPGREYITYSIKMATEDTNE